METNQERLSPTPKASRTGKGAIMLGLSRPRARISVSRALADLDHEIVSVADGYRLTQRLADVILGDDRRRPSLIVANPILAGCTGISLLSGLRDLGWDTPVIFLVGSRVDPERARVWSHGATALFVEPIDLGELKRFVELVLDPTFGFAELAEGTDPGIG